MGLSVKQGSVVAKVGTTGNLAYTGVGFTPTLLILYATAQTAEGIGVGMSLGFGAASAAGAQRAIAFAADDAVTTSNTGRRQSANAITILSNGTPTIVAEAALVSFDADGFTLNWTTVHATNAYIVHYLAVAGTDLTNVKVGEFALPTSTDTNYEVTDPGFQPDCVLLYGVADDAALPSSATQGTLCFGAATSPTARWGTTARNRDNVTTTEVSSYQRSALCFVELTTSGAVRADVDLVAFTASGFDLNVSTAPVTADRVFYIALKGARFAVGVDTLPTTAMTKKTTLAFQPSAVALFTYSLFATSVPMTTSYARLSIGSGTSSSARGNVTVVSTDGVGTTDEFMSTVTTKALRGLNTAPSVKHEADIVSFEGGGFTLDTTTADGSTIEFGYLALAPTARSLLFQTTVPTNVLLRR